ncbi:MAG: tRNA (N(6)-L-threonylcarbamoyladenosine(37)-C(2))-methylthiotransferase MtaB [Bacteriovoracaceae bacterium]
MENDSNEAYPQSADQKTVSFHTLGCRLNFSESGSIAQGFVERGYKVVPFGESTDVTFINTCTVTDGADSTCRNSIRKAFKASPEGKIVVAGCYAQMSPEEISKMQGIDLVLGTSEKYKVFDFIEEADAEQVHVDKTNEFWGAATTSADSRTRAFLKIQDGCNYVCSFCIIPQARGRSRTIEISEAVNTAKEILSQGYKEIVLTGVNIGEYASTSGQKLEELVKRVLDLEGLERLRLSSVEPNTITPELLKVLKDSPKTMDHFHIPLQSASNEILTSMRRKYRIEQYQDIISMVTSKFPNCGIGADVIVGYPGETEKQFQETYDFLSSSPLTHFHVFPFSKRKNTTAARLEDQIQHGLKKERVKALNELGAKKLSDFAKDQVGNFNQVLFEKRNKKGLFEGYTTNYLKVQVETDLELHNQIHEVELISSREGILLGQI